MSIALMVSEAFAIASGIMFKNAKASPASSDLFAIVAVASVFDALFLLAHWVMAEKYYRISLEVPFILNQGPVPAPTGWSSKAVNLTMWISCVVSSILANLSILDLGSTQNDLLMYVFNLIFTAVVIIVGSVLIYAIATIRKYLKDNEAEANTKNLWLHASSFGLMIVGQVAQIVVSLIFKAPNTLYITSLVLYMLALFSYSVLCVILWDLGTPEPDVEIEEPQPLSDVPVVQQITEEEAALRAHIWNLFVDEQANPMERSGRVTGSMIRGSQLLNKAVQ